MAREADITPDDDDGRWLTYSELAKARSISKESAERLVRRHRWRRQTDNHGLTKVFVPASWADTSPDWMDAPSNGRPNGVAHHLNGAADSRPDGPPDTPSDISPDVLTIAAALEAAFSAVREGHAGEVSALRERITQAEQAHATEVAVLRETMTVLEAKAAILEQARASAEARADRAEAALIQERSRADASQASLDEAHTLRQQAREAQQQAEAAAQAALQAADALREAEMARRWMGRLAAAWEWAGRGAPIAIGLARTGCAMRDAIGRVRKLKP